MANKKSKNNAKTKTDKDEYNLSSKNKKTLKIVGYTDSSMKDVVIWEDNDSEAVKRFEMMIDAALNYNPKKEKKKESSKKKKPGKAD